MTQDVEKSSAVNQDDRILPFSRVVAWILLPYFLAAFIIIYFGLDLEVGWFGMGSPARLTEALLGAGYLGGAYFLLRVGLGQRRHQVHLGAGYLNASSYSTQGVAKRWHEVHAGYPPGIVLLFSSLLIAVINLADFDRVSSALLIWLGLTLIAATLLLITWLVNRRKDPRLTGYGEKLVPVGVCKSIAIIGGLLIGLSIVAIVWPTAMIRVWPWMLSVIGVRFVGGLYAALGVCAFSMAADRRWNAWIIPLQSLTVCFVLLLLALLRYQEELLSADPINWYTLSLMIGLSGLIILALFMRAQTKLSR